MRVGAQLVRQLRVLALQACERVRQIVLVVEGDAKTMAIFWQRAALAVQQRQAAGSRFNVMHAGWFMAGSSNVGMVLFERGGERRAVQRGEQPC